jgi:hypothetical protein
MQRDMEEVRSKENLPERIQQQLWQLHSEGEAALPEQQLDQWQQTPS